MDLKNVGIRLHYVQGDHKQGFQKGITLKHFISDLMLPKPKCVYEVVLVNILAYNFDNVYQMMSEMLIFSHLNPKFLFGSTEVVGCDVFVFSSILGIRISDKGLAPPQNMNF